MITKKKRLRYRQNAIVLAKQYNIDLDPENWEQIWDLLNQYEEPTYLYFIGDMGGYEIKIGRSKNPGQRLQALQTWYPYQLYLYCFVPEKSPYTEKEVHKKFRHLRKQGEWFSYEQDLKEFVWKLKDEIKAR